MGVFFSWAIFVVYLYRVHFLSRETNKVFQHGKGWVHWKWSKINETLSHSLVEILHLIPVEYEQISYMRSIHYFQNIRIWVASFLFWNWISTAFGNSATRRKPSFTRVVDNLCFYNLCDFPPLRLWTALLTIWLCFFGSVACVYLMETVSWRAFPMLSCFMNFGTS